MSNIADNLDLAGASTVDAIYDLGNVPGVRGVLIAFDDDYRELAAESAANDRALAKAKLMARFAPPEQSE